MEDISTKIVEEVEDILDYVARIENERHIWWKIQEAINWATLNYEELI